MPEFTRRSILRGAGGVLGVGGLSGCLIGGRLRRYQVSNDPAPDGLPASVMAEAVRTPTNEWPLILRIEFESTADEPRNFSAEPPGGFPVGRVTAVNRAARGTTSTPSSPERLILAEPDAGALEDGCWRTAGTNDALGDPSGPDSVQLAPGESIGVERAVVNYQSNTACYPVGAYRFSVSFRSTSLGNPTSDGPSHPWGFTLNITGLRPDR